MTRTEVWSKALCQMNVNVDELKAGDGSGKATGWVFTLNNFLSSSSKYFMTMTVVLKCYQTFHTKISFKASIKPKVFFSEKVHVLTLQPTHVVMYTAVC